jgi:hypothetical protein
LPTGATAITKTGSEDRKKEKMKNVQIINNYCILDYEGRGYDALRREVKAHDAVSKSSWYSLSDRAYNEYKRWKNSKHAKPNFGN